MDALTIIRPDDWHVHLRQGAMLARAARDSARVFSRAMVMPNLSPPVTTLARALDYRAEIIKALPPDSDFEPLMSLYLTDRATPREVDAAADSGGRVVGFKWYPAGATTNTDAGVTRIADLMPVLERIAERDLVLQVHAETRDPQVDVFDREAVFIERTLAPLQRALPQLKIVLEHVTTEQGVQFVRDAGSQVAATITAHHLLLNRNEMFRRGLRPHAYCLPVLKRERHRRALLAAATGGERAFFLGTDSAPHARRDKESACGCAGIYTAHAALELYAEAFDRADALDQLEGFASHHGADFYAVARNTGTLTLHRKPWRVADSYAIDERDELVPMRAGEEVAWSVSVD
ncbi:MAG: dihydroorotase [bacterium]